jgi:hypothetical protein
MRISGHELRVALWQGKPESVPLLIFNGIGSRLELLGPFVMRAQAADKLHEVSHGPPPF